ncbi:hypothetical protein [Streptomyces sp. NPDC051001]|uniref:hypothetical protein n=1 Tax=Streptomyces sp. NPDC051001 TaxID=3155795 RepID=UPI00341B5592
MTGPRNRLTAAVTRLVAGIAIVVPAALLLGASPAAAHPMPYSVVELDVYQASVSARLELPTQATMSERAEAIPTYLGRRIGPTGTGGKAWQVSVGDLSLSSTEQTSTGPYRELVAEALLTPPPGADVRHFIFDNDVIVH